MHERPALAGTQQQPAQGAEEPVRDPNTFDPRPLLPAGTQVARALTDVGNVDIRGPQSSSSVRLVTGDGRSELAKGTFRLDGGTMPAKADEVAVSPSLAEYLGIRDGDTVRPGSTLVSSAEQAFTVVGIARTLNGPGARTIFATADNPMAKPDPALYTQYLVDLPGSAQPDPLSDQLNAKGMTLLPRANIVDPPPNCLRLQQYGCRRHRGDGIDHRLRHSRDRPARRYGVRGRRAAADPRARPGHGCRRYTSRCPTGRPAAGVVRWSSRRGRWSSDRLRARPRGQATVGADDIRPCSPPGRFPG